MKIKDILIESDSSSYIKLVSIKSEKKSEKLSECDIKELMSHSCYRRHKGAMKQVK
ncbi:hypothetical protein [Clostridium tagluense]|uniref:Uncharacterized protein n=1 Tax=Clostridium tagluense TaxID=360422 RepID=A0A401UUS1_9CLOT|nr:hypothetical protein [Clostridium tagluense]GCD13302.1 hypothetical protein Ctaglu_49250 [Clostridium tagluense]